MSCSPGGAMLDRAARFFVTATLFAVGADAGAPVLPRNGDYLSTTYLAVLEKSKSHRTAWEAETTPVITVSRDARGHVSLLLGNWHEGTRAEFDPNRPTDNLDREGGVEAPFVWIDATRFKFGDGRRTYQYVGKAETYIARRLLVGTYTDIHGRAYVFSADGNAHFPRLTFRYEIYGDMVFEDCDEFVDRDASKPNAWKTYGFEWKGQTLYLYNLDCPDTSAGCTPVKTKPLAVLHKVQSAGR